MAKQHSMVSPRDVHKPYTFEYDTEADRLNASNFKDSHIGKWAQQKNDNTVQILTDINPIKQTSLADKNIFQLLTSKNVISIQYNELNKVSNVNYSENYSVDIIYNDYSLVTMIKFYKDENLIETLNYEYDTNDNLTSVTSNRVIN